MEKKDVKKVIIIAGITIIIVIALITRKPKTINNYYLVVKPLV